MNTFSLYQRYNPPPFLGRWVVGVWVVGSFFSENRFRLTPKKQGQWHFWVERLCIGGRQQHYAAVFQNVQLIRYGGSLSLSQ